MTVLSERYKPPEMDCHTDYRKEPPSAIPCGSESANITDSSASSTSSEVVAKEASNSDGSNSDSKPETNVGQPFRSGRWTPDEKILFLYGLKMFGKGRWKKMSIYLPQRSLVQIKSHAQKVLKRQEAGENIFRRLEENRNEIDNLVVQAARQRDALRMAGINVNKPPSKARKSMVKSATKKKRTASQSTTNSSPSVQESLFQQSSKNNSRLPLHQTADSSVLAAAALCQLSSFGASWDQRDNSTINGKGQKAPI